jgi:hypothetical protein
MSKHGMVASGDCGRDRLLVLANNIGRKPISSVLGRAEGHAMVGMVRSVGGRRGLCSRDLPLALLLKLTTASDPLRTLEKS